LRNARKQNGSLYLDKNGSGCPVWMFCWNHVRPDGKRVRRKKQLGTLDQYPTEAAAERAVRGWRLAINSNQVHAFSGITVNDVIQHFRQKELVEKGESGRASSTRSRFEPYLNRWIAPRWGRNELQSVRTPAVEEWLEDLKFDLNWRKKKSSSVPVKPKRAKEGKHMQQLAPGSKAKIRDILCVLFNHAVRWGFTDHNPISGPVRGSGVRQSSKRVRIPDILEVSEMQMMVPELQLRERVLVFLDMVTGLRRSELAGLKWFDFDFVALDANIQRSVVDQIVGPCKTEASQKRIPLDPYTAADLLAWYEVTPYKAPHDFVFAASSSRAGKKRGKQPVWLSTVMRCHIQPVVKRLGITKRVSWHTFRHTYTTLLHANGEDVKVVQELLRHSSARVTMDVYAQAQMPAKRAAQQKVVEMIRPQIAGTEYQMTA